MHWSLRCNEIAQDQKVSVKWFLWAEKKRSNEMWLKIHTKKGFQHISQKALLLVALTTFFCFLSYFFRFQAKIAANGNWRGFFKALWSMLLHKLGCLVWLPQKRKQFTPSVCLAIYGEEICCELCAAKLFISGRYQEIGDRGRGVHHDSPGECWGSALCMHIPGQGVLGRVFRTEE